MDLLLILGTPHITTDPAPRIRGRWLGSAIRGAIFDFFQYRTAVTAIFKSLQVATPVAKNGSKDEGAGQ